MISIPINFLFIVIYQIIYLFVNNVISLSLYTKIVTLIIKANNKIIIKTDMMNNNILIPYIWLANNSLEYSTVTGSKIGFK